MEHPTLKELPDRSAPAETGALSELTSDASSRKRFLRMVGGTGAAGAFAMLVAACGGDDKQQGGAAQQKPAPTPAKSQFGEGDIGILNYALTLEYLEADFYEQVAATGLFKGSQLDLIKSLRENEQEHVDALKATVDQMGASPAKPVKGKFPLDDKNKILDLAGTVENVGAAAYLGAAGEIQNKEVLGAALSIHSVEARHASAIADLLEKPITPDGAFAKPMTMDQVLKAVKPFIAS